MPPEYYLFPKSLFYRFYFLQQKVDKQFFGCVLTKFVLPLQGTIEREYLICLFL